MKSIGMFSSILLFAALLFSVGCGEGVGSGNGIIGGGGDAGKGRSPDSTLSDHVFSGQNIPTRVGIGTTDGATVNFAQTGVTVSPVWLEMTELKVNGGAKSAVRVATNLPSNAGTLFVLIRVSRWAHAEDLEPVKWDDVVLTIRRGASASVWHLPEIWPGLTSMLSIMPVEELASGKLPRATAEINTILEGHKFLRYEAVAGYEHLVFPPE
ncbi:MAG: hypothetical protein OXB96_00215 [Candidatus Kaiserbacteria bacterium]|nr:hypothetical protein [Candidatus Kaiserbacteria bacterium]